MPLPTFDLQTRANQRTTLAHSKSWAYYVWLVGVEVMARTLYPSARNGDKLYAIALCPYPFVPYFVVDCGDPYRAVWMQVFIEDQHREQPKQRLNPVLCKRSILDDIATEYIVYEWPRQLGIVYRDVICPSCGMVDVVDGFELSWGANLCNDELCLRVLTYP